MKVRLIQNSVTVYAKPDPASAPVATLNRHDEFEAGTRETFAGSIWLRVALPRDERGYIPADTSFTPIITARLAQREANVYQNPSAKSVVRTTLLRGERFDIVETGGSGSHRWMRIRSMAGDHGYLLGRIRVRERSGESTGYSMAPLCYALAGAAGIWTFATINGMGHHWVLSVPAGLIVAGLLSALTYRYA